MYYIGQQKIPIIATNSIRIYEERSFLSYQLSIIIRKIENHHTRPMILLKLLTLRLFLLVPVFSWDQQLGVLILGFGWEV